MQQIGIELEKLHLWNESVVINFTSYLSRVCRKRGDIQFDAIIITSTENKRINTICFQACDGKAGGRDRERGGGKVTLDK